MEFDTGLIFNILLTLGFSAFFSGIEIAFVRSDKLQLELLSKRIPFAGRFLSYFIKAPSHFMGVTLVGNTAALVLFGMFMTEFLQPVFLSWSYEFFSQDLNFFLFQTIASTLIVLLLAEFIPKSLFMINPTSMMRIFSFPLVIMYWILYVPMLIVITLSKLSLRLIGMEYREDKPIYGMVDLNNFVKSMIDNKDSKGGRVDIDTKILNNALEFKTVKVRDCMIPRTEISAVDLEDGIEELNKTFIESGHSKILVYKESIDNVIGYCHAIELFKKPKDIQAITTPIVIVPETLLANELMVQFIAERKSLALVVDEYGGTSGVVSMEDIIEEIFGEIQDEHDDEELIETQLTENTFLLSARLEIDYINEKYGWNLPEGDYDTLGGFVVAIKENIPEKGDKISLKQLTIEVQTVHHTRVGTLKVSLNDPDSY